MARYEDQGVQVDELGEGLETSGNMAFTEGRERSVGLQVVVGRRRRWWRCARWKRQQRRESRRQ